MKHVTVANALSQSPGKIAATLKIPVLQARQLMAEVAGVRFAPQRREH